MIETQEPTDGTVLKQETPAEITTSQIIEDLENGISRDGIKEKYSLETWMVTQIFQHPELKGKKTKKVRRLPLQLIDDTSEPIDSNQTDIETAIEEVEFEETFESFDGDEETVTETNNN